MYESGMDPSFKISTENLERKNLKIRMFSFEMFDSFKIQTNENHFILKIKKRDSWFILISNHFLVWCNPFCNLVKLGNLGLVINTIVN